MEIRALKYFVAVAIEGNFRKAATNLHISQSALSQQIAKLEKQSGGLLFLRGTGQTSLTDLGEMLLPLAKRTIAEANYTYMLIQQAALGKAGRLRLSFVYSAAFSVLPGVVSSIQEVLPNVELEFVEAITEAQVERIREGEFDLGIVRENFHSDDLLHIPLLKEPLMLVAHEDNPLAARSSVSMADLAEEPIIISPRESAEGLYDQISSLCHKGGFRLHPSLTAVQFPTLVGLVAAQRGVTILPSSMSALQVPRVRYVPIQDEGNQSTLSLVVRQDRTSRPGLQAIIKQLTAK